MSTKNILLRLLYQVGTLYLYFWSIHIWSQSLPLVSKVIAFLGFIILTSVCMAKWEQVVQNDFLERFVKGLMEKTEKDKNTV